MPVHQQQQMLFYTNGTLVILIKSMEMAHFNLLLFFLLSALLFFSLPQIEKKEKADRQTPFCCSSPLGSNVMSRTIIVVFCPRARGQTRCRIGPVFILVLPDVIHFLHFQHLHHENDDELHTTGDEIQIKRKRKKKQQSVIPVRALRQAWSVRLCWLDKETERPYQEPVDIHEQQRQQESVEEEVEGDARHGLQAGHARGV